MPHHLNSKPLTGLCSSCSLLGVQYRQTRAISTSLIVGALTHHSTCPFFSLNCHRYWFLELHPSKHFYGFSDKHSLKANTFPSPPSQQFLTKEFFWSWFPDPSNETEKESDLLHYRETDTSWQRGRCSISQILHIVNHSLIQLGSVIHPHYIYVLLAIDALKKKKNPAFLHVASCRSGVGELLKNKHTRSPLV